MSIGIFFMGFVLSFLIEVDMGTDPCSFMNVSISERLPISFGTWQLICNILLFIPQILWGRKYIGPGTVFNMVFIGYIADFFRWIFNGFKKLVCRVNSRQRSKRICFLVKLDY